MIGIGCRFPNADNPLSFWNLLAAGDTAFGPVPAERIQQRSFTDQNGITGTFLQNPFLFDNRHFNISDAEAVFLDPQQRIMLELAVETLETAGYSTLKSKRAGVFIGANQVAYEEMLTSRWYRANVVDQIRHLDSFSAIPEPTRQTLLADLERLIPGEHLHPNALADNLANMIASRISHELNITGPSMTIDTACSSSLVAVHMACESLRQGESDLVFAGGVNLNLTPSVFQYMHAAGVISPSGKCIPFSKDSDGILLGEGAGMLLLKRLNEALDDQNPILGVIKGSGINNDGRSLSVMAPSWKGQLSLLQHTYKNAGFDPGRISAIEAHGTSTRIGDSVELSVIERFFPLREQPISIGSVKSNIGHTLGAAGIAGVIKMLLALHHKQLPPSVHELPNPSWKLEEKGIRIQNRLEPWTAASPRAAGISSFGFGGTNAHVILEESPAPLAAWPTPQTVFSRRYFYFDFFPQLPQKSDLLYVQNWQLVPDAAPDTVFQPDGWILICDREQDVVELRDRLTTGGRLCFVVQKHPSGAEKGSTNRVFARTGEYAFTIDTSNPDHFRWLLSGIAPATQTGILYLSGRSTQSQQAPGQFITQELLAIKHLFAAAREYTAKVKIWVATFGAYAPVPDEQAEPLQRAMAVLAGGAFAENEALRGGLIDLSPNDSSTGLSDVLGHEPAYPQIVRNGKRFMPVLQPATAGKQPRQPVSIKADGIYLVIGGSSGVGAQIAAHLAKKPVAKVIVSGSRPPEEVSNPLQKLMPAQVEYIQSSVLEGEDMRALIETIIARHGRMDGVVFAAGAIDYGSLAQKNSHSVEQVLAVKLLGVHHLYKAIQGLNPDFVYLIGSIAGLSPAWSKGIAEYAAANAYLQAFAKNLDGGSTRWITCSWGMWENIGMAAGMTASGRDGQVALTPADALACFDTTLSLGLADLIALPAEEQARYTFEWPAPGSGIPSSAKEQHKPALIFTPTPPSPMLATPDNGTADKITAEHGTPPSTPEKPDYKTLIKQLIAEALDQSAETIDDRESFYNLGLDSLSAVDVVKKFETVSGLALNPTLLFEYDSVEALSDYINHLNTGAGQGALKAKTANLEEVHADIESTPFPLLPAQQTFFANQLFYPEAPGNILVRLDSDISFDPGRLSAVWSSVLQQHDTLRIGFRMSEQGPEQYVQQFSDTPIVYYRWEDREHAADRLQGLEDELINRVFPLDQPPLFQLCCVLFSSGQSSLIFAIHHIIADAWSVNVLLKEVLEGYRQATSGLPLNPAAGRAHFADYAKYAIDRYRTIDRSADTAFWKQELENMPAGIALPYRTDMAAAIPDEHPAPAYQSVFWEADAGATQKILQTAKKWNATPFHLLLSGYFLLLYRLSQQTDLVIRIAAANREQAYDGIETLAGCLADSIPLRIAVDPADTLESLVPKVRQKLLEARKHSGLTAQDFASIQPARQQTGPAGISPAGMSFIPFDYLSKNIEHPYTAVRCRTALTFTDLSLICALVREQLICSWNFSRHQFNRSTIEVVAASYGEIMLSGCAANSNKEQAPPLFPPLEWPAVQLFPQTSLLHEKVWAACRLYPDRIALCFNNQFVTYRELQEHSFRVANTLTGHLDPAEKTAGLLAHPGPHAVYGMLGILASGRAFIPLDPDWPDGRIADMIAHAGLKTILTTAAFFDRLCANPNLVNQLDTFVLLDDSKSLLTPNGKHILSCAGASAAALMPLPAAVQPDDLAYIMYTSGTSGHPKGVMVEHQAVEVFLNWISETFAINTEDRFIHSSSLGFGGTIRQVFSTLLAGATLYPIARQQLRDPQSLLEFLEKNGITILNTVPTVLNNLLEWLEYDEQDKQDRHLTQLRLILVGGEALYPETVAKWRARFGASQAIFNLYGSTETIVNATMYEIPPAVPEKKGAIPIGYQKKGSVVRLINTAGTLCGPNEPGELLVGGPCLAKGYYREPALTEKSFVSLGHLGLDGIFYKTGDLARAGDDGLLHFLGRNDDQIQVYGNRVELVEIENAIYRTQWVKNAAVLDFPAQNNHWLIAFVALNKASADTTAADIRDFLTHALPAYMVPHKVVILEKIPLNHAGKTDRVALRRQFADAFNDPAERPVLTDTEARVAAVWAAELRTDAIGPEDDFFALGGDSILALKMLHRLRKEFPAVPQPVVLFRRRTLRALAGALDELNTGTPSDTLRPSDKQPGLEKMPLSAAQKGFVLIQKLSPSSSPNWATLVYLNGLVQVEALQRTFDYLVQRHPMLRTIFVTEGLNTWQQTLPTGPVSVEHSDISGIPVNEQDAQLKQLFDDMKRTVFDLSVLPHMLIRVIQIAPDRCAIAMSMHHIIGDAWSLHLLTGELLRVYDQILQGQRPFLAPLALTYKEVVDYYQQQENTLTASRLEERRAFWTRSMAGLPTPVPREQPDSLGETDDGPLTMLFAETTKQVLSELSQKHQATLFHLLLAMFTKVLGKLYHANDLLIGVPVSGRDVPLDGVASVVGCFARNLPLRISLPVDPDLDHTLETVKDVFLQALENQDIPPREFYKIISNSGKKSIFSANRFMFSFMDFSALASYSGQHFSIDWDRSDIYFNSGSAEMELMLGVRVSDTLLINVHGRAPLSLKKQLEEMMRVEIEEFTKQAAHLPQQKPEHRIKTIDSALIAYLPAISRLEQLLPSGAIRPALLRSWIQKLLPAGEPRLLEITATPFGSSGLVFLPADADALEGLSGRELAGQITAAIRLGSAYGATHISLAGVLPAKTNYGYSVLAALQEAEPTLPPCTLTTGHACTVVAVVKTIEKVLAAIPVNLDQTQIAVVGFGSIGQATVSLLLSVIGAPARFVIADLAKQLPLLKEPLARLQKQYPGPVQVSPVVEGIIPETVYESDLIIGASSTGNILDVAKLRPGTILIDDSFPAIVPAAAAIRRMETAKDVLLLGGGKLDLGPKSRELLQNDIPESMLLELIRQFGDDGLPGCRAEPLLMHLDPSLPGTIGLVNSEHAILYWEKITGLGIGAVDFHLAGFAVPASLLEHVAGLLNIRI